MSRMMRWLAIGGVGMTLGFGFATYLPQDRATPHGAAANDASVATGTVQGRLAQLEAWRAVTDRPKGIHEHVREWGAWAVALLSFLVSAWSMAAGRENSARTKRVEANRDLDQAWDLLGDEEGAGWVHRYTSDQRTLEKVRRLSRAAENLDPKNPRVYRIQSAYWRALGQTEKAFESARQCVALDPSYVRGHNLFGLLLMEIGRHEEAEAAYRTAIELDPTDALPHVGLGTLLAKQHRDEEAESAFWEAIKIGPAHAGPYNNLGNLLAKQERDEEAEAAFRKAMELDPITGGARKNLGNLLAKQGRKNEAETVYREAIELDPANDEDVLVSDL